MISERESVVNRVRVEGAETPVEGLDGSPVHPVVGTLDGPGAPVRRGRQAAIVVAVLVVIGLVVALALTRGGSSSTSGSKEDRLVADLKSHGWVAPDSLRATVVADAKGMCDYWEAGGFMAGAELQYIGAGLTKDQAVQFITAATMIYCPVFVGKLDPDRFVSG